MLQHILEHGERRENRTGVDTLAVFGYQTRFNLQEGFPLVTTKKMFTRGIFSELEWFVRGMTNIKFLVDRNVHIWDADAYRQYKTTPAYAGETHEAFVEKIASDDEFANQHGELGPVYGRQWRNFNGVDQLQTLVEGIKHNPASRRHILTAWNPADIGMMTLPPCHVLTQWNVRTDGTLDCHLYQRSADTFLGVPFNIASYAALMHVVAKVTDTKPGDFVHTFGDLHLYENHLPAVQEQLARNPLPLPTLTVSDTLRDIDSFRAEQLTLHNYQSHDKLIAPLNAG